MQLPLHLQQPLLSIDSAIWQHYWVMLNMALGMMGVGNVLGELV